jgi:lycopene cyclase domain-containing protein
VTYGGFLLAFVVPPIVALVAWLALRRQGSRRLLAALAITATIAVVYTGPWDHFIISQGVWSYPEGRVIGPTIGLVPVEEYAFFVLQVLLTGLLTFALRRGTNLTPRPLSLGERGRPGGGDDGPPAVRAPGASPPSQGGQQRGLPSRFLPLPRWGRGPGG